MSTPNGLEHLRDTLFVRTLKDGTIASLDAHDWKTDADRLTDWLIDKPGADVPAIGDNDPSYARVVFAHALSEATRWLLSYDDAATRNTVWANMRDLVDLYWDINN